VKCFVIARRKPNAQKLGKWFSGHGEIFFATLNKL
jgi:hypothetical protein